MKSLPKSILPMAFAAASCLAATSATADKIFLKFTPEIKGEATDPGHEDEIDVLAWSWQQSLPVSLSSAGMETGKPIIRPIVITKEFDLASSTMYKNLWTGKGLDKATLSVNRTGGDGLSEYLRIDLKDVVVSSATPGGDVSSIKVQENFSLHFGYVCITYSAQDVSGKLTPEPPVCWDLVNNTGN